MKSTCKLAVFCVLVAVAISCIAADGTSQYSDLPPPPVKPEKFTSKQQLKEYLVKLHEYYAIIGRPRFGRSFGGSFHNKRPMLFPSESERDLMASENFASESADTSIPTPMIVELIDQNNDGVTTKEELFSFLKIFNSKL